MRPWSKSVDAPEDSLLNRILAPAPSEESTATKKTTTPNPPTHWLSERHRSRLFGNSAKLEYAVAPVVVRPDALSKMASDRSQCVVKV